MDADISRPFEVVFLVFKAAGMWQDGKQSCRYFVYGCLLHFVLLDLYLICQIKYAINANDLDDFVETISLASTYAGEIFKCWNFFFRINFIVESFENLKALMEFSAHSDAKNREIVRSHIKIAFRVLKVSWAMALITCSSAILVPLFNHKLPFKLWFPFNTEHGDAGFWPASVYSVLNSYVVSAIEINLVCLPAYFMSCGAGLMDELCDRLNNIGSDDGGQNNKLAEEEKQKRQETELLKCIEVHKKIKMFVGEIQDNFAISILLQGLFSAVIFCSNAYVLSVIPIRDEPSSFFRVFSFIIPMVLELLIPCYFGSNLSIASSRLSTALFHSEWSQGSIKLRQSMKMFIENTKKDLKISAFGVFDANLATFTSVVNSAYSLFAVLKRMNEN